VSGFQHLAQAGAQHDGVLFPLQRGAKLIMHQFSGQMRKHPQVAVHARAFPHDEQNNQAHRLMIQRAPFHTARQPGTGFSSAGSLR